MGADLQDQVHSYHDVEQEVTVEQPESCTGRDGNMEVMEKRVIMQG